MPKQMLSRQVGKNFSNIVIIKLGLGVLLNSIKGKAMVIGIFLKLCNLINCFLLHFSKPPSKLFTKARFMLKVNVVSPPVRKPK